MDRQVNMMLSSEDWAIMVTLKKELESLQALYSRPTEEVKTVMRWLDKRIKKIEEKANDS